MSKNTSIVLKFSGVHPNQIPHIHSFLKSDEAKTKESFNGWTGPGSAGDGYAPRPFLGLLKVREEESKDTYSVDIAVNLHPLGRKGDGPFCEIQCRPELVMKLLQVIDPKLFTTSVQLEGELLELFKEFIGKKFRYDIVVSTFHQPRKDETIIPANQILTKEVLVAAIRKLPLVMMTDRQRTIFSPEEEFLKALGMANEKVRVWNTLHDTPFFEQLR